MISPRLLVIQSPLPTIDPRIRAAQLLTRLRYVGSRMLRQSETLPHPAGLSVVMDLGARHSGARMAQTGMDIAGGRAGHSLDAGRKDRVANRVLNCVGLERTFWRSTTRWQGRRVEGLDRVRGRRHLSWLVLRRMSDLDLKETMGLHLHRSPTEGGPEAF
jgi:hypothetical protein